MQGSLSQRVKTALLSILEELPPPLPRPEIVAGMLIEKDRALGFEQLLETWTRSAKDLMRDRAAPASGIQMVFGFRLDQELKLTDGSKVIVAEASIPKLQDRIRAVPIELEEKKEAARQRMERATEQELERLEHQAEEEIERLRAVIAEMRLRKTPHESINVREMEERRLRAAGVGSPREKSTAPVTR